MWFIGCSCMQAFEWNSVMCRVVCAIDSSELVSFHGVCVWGSSDNDCQYCDPKPHIYHNGFSLRHVKLVEQKVTSWCLVLAIQLQHNTILSLKIVLATYTKCICDIHLLQISKPKYGKVWQMSTEEVVPAMHWCHKLWFVVIVLDC